MSNAGQLTTCCNGLMPQEMYFYASRIAPLARLPTEFQALAGPPAQTTAQQA
jgi:hypothetical protein